jgi:predicted neuraminidase/peroxiredoxin
MVLTLPAAIAPAVEVGQAVGPVELRTFEDHSITMDNYAARKGTVVVFLSSRCDATEQAAAEFNRIHVANRLKEILFVGVCSNPAEPTDALRTFCQTRGMIFPVYRDLDKKVARQFGAKVTPEFFLLDAKGVVRYRGSLTGPTEGSSLEAAIRALQADRSIEVTDIPAHGTPIDQPGPDRTIDNPYGTIAFSSELIFETIPGAPVHHCSTITEVRNGDLLCLWYGGSYESAEDQVLFLSRRSTGSRDWSPPHVVVRNLGAPPGNAVIFTDGLDRAWIVWGRMESERPIRRGSGWGQCRLLYRTSDDLGRTWSEDKVLHDELGWLPRNATVMLRDGTLALPLSGRVDGSYGSFLLTTKDHGRTWQRSGVVRGGSQPTFIERDDESLFMMMRRSPRIMQSTSADGGKSWASAEQSKLKNPGAGIAMTKLRNGHVLLVFNDTDHEPRSPLSVARSLDDGRTWEKPIELESNLGEYSYPCIIQTRDDRIHITYTCRRWAIKHVEMNEDWLFRFERPD